MGLLCKMHFFCWLHSSFGKNSTISFTELYPVFIASPAGKGQSTRFPLSTCLLLFVCKATRPQKWTEPSHALERPLAGKPGKGTGFLPGHPSLPSPWVCGSPVTLECVPGKLELEARGQGWDSMQLTAVPLSLGQRGPGQSPMSCLMEGRSWGFAERSPRTGAHFRAQGIHQP